MKNQLKNLLGLTLALLLFSCGDDDDDNSECIEASGPVTTEERVVDNFSSIRFNGVGNLLLTQGAPQSVELVTNENILELIETRVSSGTLIVGFVDDACIEGSIDQLDIVVTVPEIETLALEGVGNITGENDFDLDALSIELDGVGNVILSGTVTNLEIASTGVGNVQAFDLESDICEVNLTGVGSVSVTVNSELDVNLTGAGSVRYKGRPTISSSISGTGSLIDAN